VQDLELPARLGRYELLARIAVGGMAEVFAGRIVGESGFAKLVAIKVMKEELLGEERFISMFIDEARVAAHLSHPNVVGILDLGRTDRGVPYLVMDLVIGASVSQLLKGDAGLEPAPMPVDLAIELTAQVAEGLHAAHEAKDALGTPLEIVHRDVSPQNILVGIDGRARITDFGVARAVARLTRTESGEVKGKARYFSPEQAQGKVVDRRADLFALGVVLWEMLALKPLFTGRTFADVLRAVSTQPAPDVRQHRPDVPEAVVQVIASALEKNLEARVPSGAELARALRAAGETAGVRVPRSSAVAAFVESRAGRTIAELTGEIRERTSSSIELPLVGDTTDGDDHGFTDEEPTTVDPEIARLHQARRDVAHVRRESAPRLSDVAVTIPDRVPDARMKAAVADAVATMEARAREAATDERKPRGGVRTLPLGVMTPADLAAEVQRAAASSPAPAASMPSTAVCPRCNREVALDTLGFAEDGSKVCKPCLSAEVIEEGDRGAVSTLAGMGYGALLSGVLTLCMTWIPYLNLVPAVLAIGSASAFFVHVSRSPEHRRRMGWQLPAATVCAAIGLALGLLAPLTYLLVALGLAAGAR
jgi:serine/threonine protein kinase